jgi:hypothetical protein
LYWPKATLGSAGGLDATGASVPPQLTTPIATAVHTAIIKVLQRVRRIRGE